jgi:hypothetical protein
MRESRTGHIKILNENIKNNLNKETEIRRITQEAALQVEVVMQLITTLHLEVVIMRNTALHLKVVTQDPDDIEMIIIGIHAIVKLIIALRLEVVCHTALRLEAVATDYGDVQYVHDCHRRNPQGGGDTGSRGQKPYQQDRGSSHGSDSSDDAYDSTDDDSRI